jgi:hypothetical protein
MCITPFQNVYIYIYIYIYMCYMYCKLDRINYRTCQQFIALYVRDKINEFDVI